MPAATSRAIRAPGVSLETEAAAGVRAGAARSVETAIGATFGAGRLPHGLLLLDAGAPGPVPADTSAGSSSSSGSPRAPNSSRSCVWAAASASPKPGAYCSMSGGIPWPALWSWSGR